MFDENIIKLITKWANGGPAGIPAALEICRDLLFFRPDPLAKEKAARSEKDPEDWTTSLDPSPPFQDWEYARVLKRAVRPLAEAAPLPTAKLLIEVAAHLLVLDTGRRADAVKEQRNDASEIMSPRLDVGTRPYASPKDDLFRTLTFACEQVFARGDTDEIEQLDRELRNAKWYLFARIRYHLYAKYPDRTEQWIRDEIVSYKSYSSETYGFEFQRMVRIGAEHFAKALIPPNELHRIFEAIIDAPDKEDYKHFMGEEFTEEGYRRRQDYFQLRQLRPFAPLLFGKFLKKYSTLVAAGRELTDDDFVRHHVGESKTGASRSPKSLGELAALSDDELVAFLNEWQDVTRDPDQWWVDIDFTGLAIAFRQLIAENPDRFLRWEERWQRLERPIYFRYALEAAAKRLSQNPSEVPVWLDVADWILSRQDSEPIDADKASEDSRDKPNWNSARRQVVDVIGICIGKEEKISLEWRSRVLALLTAACVAPDYYLDADRAVVTPRDYLTDAINTTRGRALETLLLYGFWVRRDAADADVSDVFRILDLRFDGRPLLALAEHALLGASFHQLYGLSAEEAERSSAKVFPVGDINRWGSAFAAYLRFNRAHTLVFDIFKPHFEFALEHLRLLQDEENTRNDALTSLGQHLLDYFMLGRVELRGSNSLLEAYYRKTKPAVWASLFDHVGRLLSHTHDLNPQVAARIREFFETRLADANPEELKEFTFWLQADCLEPEWRLKAFQKTLGIAKGTRYATSMVTDDLAKLIHAVPDLVVETFAQLTETLLDQSYFYLRPERVKIILKTGLASELPETVRAATFARDNLLKAGRTEYRDLDAIKDDPNWLRDD